MSVSNAKRRRSSSAVAVSPPDLGALMEQYWAFHGPEIADSLMSSWQRAGGSRLGCDRPHRMTPELAALLCSPEYHYWCASLPHVGLKPPLWSWLRGAGLDAPLTNESKPESAMSLPELVAHRIAADHRFQLPKVPSPHRSSVPTLALKERTPSTPRALSEDTRVLTTTAASKSALVDVATSPQKEFPGADACTPGARGWTPCGSDLSPTPRSHSTIFAPTSSTTGRTGRDTALHLAREQARREKLQQQQGYTGQHTYSPVVQAMNFADVPITDERLSPLTPARNSPMPPPVLPQLQQSGNTDALLVQYYLGKLNETLKLADAVREEGRRAVLQEAHLRKRAEEERDSFKDNFMSSQTTLNRSQQSAQLAIQRATELEVAMRDLEHRLHTLQHRDERRDLDMSEMQRLRDMNKVHHDSLQQQYQALKDEQRKWLVEQLSLRNELKKEKADAEERKTSHDELMSRMIASQLRERKEHQNEVHRLQEEIRKLQQELAIRDVRLSSVADEAHGKAEELEQALERLTALKEHVKALQTERDEMWQRYNAATPCPGGDTMLQFQEALALVEANAEQLRRMCLQAREQEESQSRNKMLHNEALVRLSLRQFHELSLVAFFHGGMA